MEVILYTQEGCGACHQAKSWLSRMGIEFEDRDITENPEYLDELDALGSNGTPTTLIRRTPDEQEIIVGFDRRKLQQRLDI